MKICEKESCKKEHDKPGRFCSRTCANGRNHSIETRNKIAESNRKNPVKVKRTKKEVSEHLSKVGIERTSKKTFEEVGWDTKRIRVIKEQNGCCSKCGISNWQGQEITLEVDHIDGNNKNHSRENLEALCPNCHSITDTWRGRNKTRIKVTDEEIVRALEEYKNIRQALQSLGVAAKGGNYKRAKILMG
jgi:5-methylcytosine-specific restriction endonuclease McrA